MKYGNVLAAGVAVIVLVGLSPYTGAGEEKKDEEQGKHGRKAEMQERVESRFAEMDADKDGKATFEEFKAWHEAKLKERFDSMDADKDGAVSKEEFLSRERKDAGRRNCGCGKNCMENQGCKTGQQDKKAE